MEDVRSTSSGELVVHLDEEAYSGRGALLGGSRAGCRNRKKSDVLQQRCLGHRHTGQDNAGRNSDQEFPGVNRHFRYQRKALEPQPEKAHGYQTRVIIVPVRASEAKRNPKSFQGAKVDPFQGERDRTGSLSRSSGGRGAWECPFSVEPRISSMQITIYL